MSDADVRRTTCARRSATRTSRSRSRTCSAGPRRRSTPSGFQEGRVFVAGDAAHVMPPTGGFGGNAGIQDAYDLAWKLAHVLDGRADESLLETYDAERQPGRRAHDRAGVHALRAPPRSRARQGRSHADRRARRRSSSATGTGQQAIVSETSEPTRCREDPREPSARPGFRAPHAPVTVAGVEQSTLDLFGHDFVVLAGSNGEDWCSGARAAGDSLGVAVNAYRIGTDVSDADGRARDSLRHRPGRRGARSAGRVRLLAKRRGAREPCRRANSRAGRGSWPRRLFRRLTRASGRRRWGGAVTCTSNRRRPRG